MYYIAFFLFSLIVLRENYGNIFLVMVQQSEFIRTNIKVGQCPFE